MVVLAHDGENILLGIFRKSDEEGSDLLLTWERMSWEIKGSVFSLLTLFLLISLSSYIQIDSFHLQEGRLDHMNNLGGIVGAALAEAFLGSVGIVGYSIVFVTLWLSFSAFKQVPIRENLFRVIGSVIVMLLASIATHLAFIGEFPEASLFVGGHVGKVIGPILVKYFNTTGAYLIISFLFLMTLILTCGFSITNLSDRFWNGEQVDEDDDMELLPIKKPHPSKVIPIRRALEKESKPKRKRKSRQKSDSESDDEKSSNDNPTLDSTENEVDSGSVSLAPTDGEFQELIPFFGSSPAPSPRLLKSFSGGKRVSRGELKATAKKLCEQLLSFQITGEVETASVGPILTTYEYKPTAGIKLSKIAALQDDLGVVLGTRELRIIAPIPGKTVVGIEVPRENPEIISLKDVISQKGFMDKKIKIPIATGKTTDGEPVFNDLTTMPHLLVAGATGTGKSVFINCLILSLIYRLSPSELRLILIDPKMLELNVFDGLPHLISPVITDNNIAFNALSWAVIEMDRRYNLMAETGSKNFDSYNSKMKSKSEKLPYIVIVVDELADLMLSGGEAVEVAITRLCQKARAAGIHLVIATQRPSTDVITGLIKANIPSRISFKVPSGIDSRTILDSSGAEELIGRGDMLMVQPGIPMRRLHGCYVTEEELVRVVKFIKNGKNFSKFTIDFSVGLSSASSTPTKSEEE